MQRLTLFITSPDTGVGKTTLAVALTGQLRAAGIAIVALKPVCSGGRDDARQLQAALGGALSLDEINPWHFKRPLAPVLAARRERRSLALADVLAHARRWRNRCEVLLIEGVGGLLSPIGEGFDNRDLIAALRATPVIVCPNRLGAVSQSLLVLAALPPAAARRAQVVLVTQLQPDTSSRCNRALLVEKLGEERIHCLPWLGESFRAQSKLISKEVDRMLSALWLKAVARQPGLRSPRRRKRTPSRPYRK